MIKVTFQTRGGVYWAVYERVDLYDDEDYQLSSIMENSRGTGPAVWTIIPETWRIITVEEV